MGNSVALILPSLFVLYLDSEITWRMPNQSDGRSEHGSGAVLPDGAPFCLPRQRPRASGFAAKLCFASLWHGASAPLTAVWCTITVP
jgi:hypothetical protein